MTSSASRWTSTNCGVTIQNALEASKLRTEVQSLRGEVRRRTGYHDVVAVSSEDDGADELRAKGRRQRSHHDSDSGRKRHRQGSDRQDHPLREHPPGQAVRRHQLLGHPRDADGGRTLRPREGRLHRRQGDEEGPVRNRRTAARCFWTKSANSRPCCRPSCCACWKIRSFGGWAACGTCRWTCA